MVKLTISIVNYNAGEFLNRCLESLDKVKDEISMEIYVVDNASTDDSIENAKKNFPDVHFVLNAENLGFGKAHNLVLKNIKTDYILLLNPDTEVKKGVLSYIYNFMEENPNVGVLTAKVIQGDHKIDWAAHRGFPTPFASLLYFLGNDSLYHLSKQDFYKNHEVDAVSGAFLFTRKSVLEKVGIFDEDYFMYAEDIDLCYRIKTSGYKIMYLSEVEILHHKGVSSGLKKHSLGVSTATQETRFRSLNAFYETMKIFYKKHYAHKYPFFINWLIYFAINLKWFLAKRKLTV